MTIRIRLALTAVWFSALSTWPPSWGRADDFIRLGASILYFAMLVWPERDWLDR